MLGQDASLENERMFDMDVRDGGDELERKPIWQRMQAPKVAALDLGSNSFHLIVAELGGEARFDVIERLKERVQLGESTFQTGRIGPDLFERALAALRRLRSVVRRHAPETVIAVATSAVRDAENGAHFLQNAIDTAGFPISVIDGLEEARLVCLGTQASVALGGRRMALFDVGGGSTEAVLADAHDTLLTTSLDLGVLRLRGMWACQDPPTSADLARLERRVAKTLEPTLAHLARLGFDVVVFSCGTARLLHRLALAQSSGAGGTPPLPLPDARLDLKSLIRLERRLARLGEDARTQLAGEDPARVDTLLTGAVTLRVLMQRIGVDEAIVSNTGLREGLVTDYARKRATLQLSRIG
jgi:exopolyphosphatase/guanosine-5'-triphosphate,3'-diphosphate pyrophosphatase